MKISLQLQKSFKKSSTEINNTFANEAKFLYIATPMYNLIEYSDKYSDRSGILWQFKRDEIAGNSKSTIADSSSFKYKSDFVGDTEVYGTRSGVKIAVPLKYSSNFWRSLEMPLINCKVKLSLKLAEKFILTTSISTVNGTIANAVGLTFIITDAKTLCLNCYFINRRQCEIIKTIK